MVLRLMIPGPAEVSESVLSELGGPIRAHYGAEWTAIHNETLRLLQQVMRTENQVFLMPGSGNAGNEAALGSMLREGDKAIVGANGMFGDRLVEIARAYGAEVIEIKADPGTPLPPGEFAQALRRHADAALVAVVHLETSTGVLNPVQAIAQAARSASIPVMVDAVSSLGGAELPVDEWRIDVCASASQKCLSAPPGLAMVAVSPAVWPQIERPRARGWYLNLNVWRRYAVEWGDWHPFPGTQPTNVVLALREALRQLVAAGLEQRLARYHALATRLRSGLVELGMPPVVSDEFSAPVLTAVWVPAGTTCTEIVAYVMKEHGIQIARGFGALRDRVCRIGHMGSEVDEALIDALLAALEEFMAKRGGPTKANP
jgi:alanine-glyoxylate transaminase/serine-glyoxylate transaminase/serine-pyruvate transaminase